MQSTRWMLSLAAGIGLATAGCSSPPPLPPQQVKEPKSKTVAAAPQGVLAPVDDWKRRLAEVIPAPWRLESVEAQINAPVQWSRLKGDRGLRLTFGNGVERQSYWVMPEGFEGETAFPEQAARERTRNDTFILFEPATDAPTWGGSALVEEALGFTVQ